MEVSDQDKSCNKRNKPRKTKQKVTNLHLRLCPDFDVKKSLSQNNALPNRERIKQSTNEEELNPKTMEFEKLVELIEPELILEYLRKVKNFLQSDLCELSFPDIPPLVEEFLLKLAQENVKFKCYEFNKDCKEVAKDILRILEKEKRFKFSLVYGGGGYNKNVLVYKKVFIAEPKTMEDKNKLMERTPSTPEAIRTKLGGLFIERQDIPPTLKLQILNSTLKLIKDNTRTILEYPPMSYQHAAHVFFLLRSAYSKDTNIGFGFKSLYASLYEAMEIASLTHDFRVEFFDLADGTAIPPMPYQHAAHVFFLLRSAYNKDTNIGFGFKSLYASLYEAMELASLTCDFTVEFFDLADGTANLVIHKTAKKVVQPCNNGVNQDSSTNTSTQNSPEAKMQRDLLIKKRVIESLPPTFIKSSLKEVLDFLEDEGRASLEFKAITSNDSRFLQSIPSLARVEEYHQFFDEECVVILKKIARNRRKKTYQLTMDVGKKDKKTGFRDLLMYKTPNGETPVKSPLKKRNIILQDINKSQNTKSTEENKPNKFQTALEKVTNANNLQITVAGRNDSRVVNPAPATTTKGRKLLKKTIAFESAGLQDIDTLGTKRVEATPTTGSARKDKLIQAMSVPLEIDNAKRMMQLMGWDGGSLGIRGDGITEPIIPALHISPGAGLGHLKPPPSQQAVVSESFRLRFLRELLAWIHKGENSTTIMFGPINKKESKFISPTLKCFNERRPIGFNSEEEMALVRQIVEAMNNEPGLYIDFAVTPERVGITFRRRKNKPNKKNPEDNKAIKNDTEDCTKIIEELNTLYESLDLENRCSSPKAALHLAIRLLFLQKIKEFCQSDEDKRQIPFHLILNKKQRQFIQGVAANVNKRAITNYNSQMENELFSEIRLKNLEFLKISFSYKTVILEKKKYQKNVKDFPPERNCKTTIYINNVPIQEFDAADYNLLTQEFKMTERSNVFTPEFKMADESNVPNQQFQMDDISNMPVF